MEFLIVTIAAAVILAILAQHLPRWAGMLGFVIVILLAVMSFVNEKR